MLTLDWSLQSAAIETALLVLGPGCRVALHQSVSWLDQGMFSTVGDAICMQDNSWNLPNIPESLFAAKEALEIRAQVPESRNKQNKVEQA